MSGESSIRLLASQALRGVENYAVWKPQIRTLLQSRSLCQYIDEEKAMEKPQQREGEKPEDFALRNKPYHEWSVNDAKARLILNQNVSEEAILLISETKTAREIWTIFQTMYEGQGYHLLYQSVMEVSNIRYEHYNSVTSYIVNFKTLVQKIAALKLGTDEKWFCVLFIGGLDNAFPVWADRQRSNYRSSGTTITLETLVADIADEARKAESNKVALYTKQPSKDGKMDKSNRKKCSHCHKGNHEAKDCYILHPEKLAEQKAKRGENKSKKKGKEETKQQQLALATGFATTTFNRNRWLSDSGATTHVTNDRGDFSDYVESANLPEVETANGWAKPQGTGTVMIRTLLSNGTAEITLRNTVYVPTFPVKIFSSLKLLLLDGYITKTALFKADGSEISLTDTSASGTYLRIANQAVHATSSVEQPLELWHRRLGHTGADNTNRTSELVHGVKIKGSTSIQGCTVCDIAKPIRHVSRTPQLRAESPFDMVHVDVEQITPTGHNGHNWGTIFTDDAARVRFAYTHKSKEEAYSAICHFNDMAKTQYNKTVKCYHIDGGKEFGGKKIEALCKKQGTLLKLTTPYTPEMAGIAERSNRTLFERVRSAILDRNIPRDLWPEVLKAEVYITNRVATTALKVTPYESFMSYFNPEKDNKPDLSHLRVLGCRANVHIPQQRRVKSAKLEPRAEVGILVGFEGTHIYRVWIPTRSHKLVRTSHVTFDEGYGYCENPEFPMRDTYDTNVSQEPTADTDTSQAGSGPDHAFEELVEKEKVNDVVTEPQAPKRGRPKGSKNKKGSELGSVIDLNAQRSLRSATPAIPPSNAPETQKDNMPGTFSVFATALHHGYVLATTENEEPTSYKEAMASQNASEWAEAMKSELRSLVDNKTWDIVDAPPQAKPLHVKWVYKVKRDANGNISRYKARLVVKGYEQRYGIDYEQTFAGVAKGAAWKAILAIAAVNDWEIEQMDVTTAFLHGDIDGDVYVDIPVGVSAQVLSNLSNQQLPAGAITLKLNKALYGLKQSPRLWQEKLSSTLIKTLGFVSFHSDHCIYRHPDTGVIIVTYVDDFLLIGPYGKALKQLKEDLATHFKIQDLGACNYFLGVRVIRDRKQGTLSLLQDTYIDKILSRYGMDTAKPVATPMEVGAAPNFVKFDGNATGEDIQLYAGIVGSILYLVTQTRVDCAYPASVLSRFLNNPSPFHLKAAKRVLSYLKPTRNACITFGGAKCNGTLSIHGYTDSDYAGCQETRRSTSGYVFYIAGGPFSWKSKRQTSVTLSSTEAEYYGLSNASREATWIRQFLTDIGYGGAEANTSLILADNQSSIALAKNPEFHQRTKHIDIQWHYIREQVAKGVVNVQYVSTTEMAADGLTKALPAPLHRHFLTLLGLKEANLN